EKVYNDAVDAHESAIKDHNDALTDYDQAEKVYNDAVDAHESAIKDHNDALTDYDQAEKVYNDAVDAHEKAIKDHNDALTDYDKAEQAYNDAVDAHESAIEDHNDAMDALMKDAQEAYDDAKADYDKALAAYEAAKDAYDEALAAYEAEVGKSSGEEGDIHAAMLGIGAMLGISSEVNAENEIAYTIALPFAGLLDLDHAAQAIGESFSFKLELSNMTEAQVAAIVDQLNGAEHVSAALADGYIDVTLDGSYVPAGDLTFKLALDSFADDVHGATVGIAGVEQDVVPVITATADGGELYGTEGNDIIIGSDYDDIIYGGHGSDIFAWEADRLGGDDTIVDFSFNYEWHDGKLDAIVGMDNDKIRLDFKDLLGDPEGSLDALLANLHEDGNGQFSSGDFMVRFTETNQMEIVFTGTASHVEQHITVNAGHDFIDHSVQQITAAEAAAILQQILISNS
ncbi:MAG: hypothetical protein FWG04_03570, partial [Desulfovibrionaceae bacterium]|nr:hypothetical protein [Desulfovibrionaceae bacterium]